LSSARRKAALAPLLAAPPEEDQTSWLVTFSDLVLQLFAFVLVALVLGQARVRNAPPVPPGIAPSGIDQPAITDVLAATAPHAGRTAPATSLPAAPEHATGATLSQAEGARSGLAPQARIGGESAAPPPRLGDRGIASAARSADVVEDPAGAPAASQSDATEPPVAAASSSTPPSRAVNDLAVAPAVVPPESGVAEAEGESADARAAELGGLGEYLGAFVAAAGLGDGVTVATDATGVRVALHGGVGFSSGSAELGPAAAPLLRELRKLVHTLPDVQIQVAGYTDDVPIHGGRFGSNLELSLARAARVARELGAEQPDATVAMGFGAQDAIASNADPRGRARNRRVEVRLLPMRLRSLRSRGASPRE
jgi:flagellar motor protein MotB